MADTIPDVQLSKTAYVDVYAATGIVVGTGLVIQNKSSQDVRIQLSASQPASSSTDGDILRPYLEATVDSGETGCWVLGLAEGTISVQER